MNRKFLAIILLSLTLSSIAEAQDDYADAVSVSGLTQVNLPRGTLLVRDENVPSEYKQLFRQFVESSPPSSHGKVELFVINAGGSGKSDAAKLRAQFENNLRNAGWNYEIHGEENGITMFTAIKKTPARKNILGYWVPVENRLMLAMTEVFYGKTGAAVGDNSSISKQSQTSSNGSQTFNLSASDENINVMGEQMPRMPSFPPLSKKPGKIKGYVKDTNGNFLRGAAIGLGSIRIGYSRMITQTVTDTKGYYELDLPLNSTNFHFAAYAVDYGAGKAAMALHPADGVENFVLLPYGIANRSMLAENSNYGASFYGGSISLFINVGYVGADDSINKGSFYPGSQIEITLTPEGNLIDGSPSKTFMIRKKIDENTRNTLFINNIPVGKYKLAIKTNGKSVGMKQRLPENSIYGIKPTEAIGEAEILFYPRSGKPTEIGAGSGGWQNVEIYLESLST